MEDTQESTLPVSLVPSGVYKVPSFTDLLSVLTGLIGFLVGSYALGAKLITGFLVFQNEVPVRNYLTNAGIKFFHACDVMTVNQSLGVFILLACICHIVNFLEKRQCQKKRKEVANLRFDWLHRLLATEDADSQDDAGPVGAASQLPRKQTRKKINKTFFLENPIEDLFVILGYILCVLICIILMPNVSADSLLEFLRTENQQNQFSFFVLLIILTLLLRMKVRDQYKKCQIVMTNLVINCIFHLEFNTWSNFRYEKKDCTPRIFCAVFVMGYIIIRAYCLANLSQMSNYGMQMFLLCAVFEDPQISWENAALCIIYICVLLYLDSYTEWPCRDTVTTPICIVPGSRLLRQGCWYGDSHISYDLKQKEWMKNYDDDIRIMAWVVFFLNGLFVYLHCRNTRKRLKKVYAKHFKPLIAERKSCAEYTFGLAHVVCNANLWLFAIIIAWSMVELLLSSNMQFDLFQMMTVKKNFVLQFVNGDVFQKDNAMLITCSWSNAGGASTAGTVSNSSWFNWS